MAFTCPKCGMTSHHPKDEEFGYCGNCHEFTGRKPQPLRIVDYFHLMHPSVPRETWEQMRKLAETLKGLAEEWAAKGGRFIWPHELPDPPPTVTLTPYFANPGGITMPRATLEEAAELRFVTDKGRLGTAVEVMIDQMLPKEFEPDEE